jgi:hypothetical protein
MAAMRFLLPTLFLRQAILGRLGIFLPVSFVCRATFTRRVMFGLQMSLMRRATVARRIIFRCIGEFRATFARRLDALRATVSLFWGPQFSRVKSFGFWRRRSAASFRSLCRFFFGSPTGITSASSTGASRCFAASGFLSAEVGSSSS